MSHQAQEDGRIEEDGLLLDGSGPSEEDLNRQLERLRRALSAAGIGIWDWDMATGEMSYCARAREICGLPAEGPVTIETARSVTHPDDLPHTWRASRQALDPDTRADVSYVYRIIRQDDGRIRWVRARGVAEFAGAGPDEKAVRYTGTLEDITEAEQLRRALIESEARLRIAVDAAQMAVWELDLETDEVTPSPELNRLYGFPPEARPASDDFRSRYAPGERERLEQAGAEATKRGESLFQSRVKHVFPDGAEKVFVVRASLAPEDGTDRKRALGVVFDVTEQVRQEEQLAVAAHELRHRLKNMASIVSVMAGRTWPRDARYQSFVGRIRAMTAAADLMFGREVTLVTVSHVVDRVLAPFREEGDARFVVGPLPEVSLLEKKASGLAMVLYELCTNATKYGALSSREGQVRLNARLMPEGDLQIDWTETGGPPVSTPDHDGFGMVLLREGALAPPDRIVLDFRPDGLRATILVHR